MSNQNAKDQQLDPDEEQPNEGAQAQIDTDQPEIPGSSATVSGPTPSSSSATASGPTPFPSITSRIIGVVLH